MIDEKIKQEFFSLRDRILEEEYCHLNKEQKEAVFCTEGPLLILAGAGSGKTTVLTNRIAHLIRFGHSFNSDYVPQDLTEADLELMREYLSIDKSGKTMEIRHQITNLIYENKVYPGNILAITFTNKAAQEMRERLEKLVGIASQQLCVATFHSTCLRILRSEIKELGYTSNFVIYDDSDQQTLIKMILKERNIDDKKYTPRAISNKISSYKNELHTPDAARREPDNTYYDEQIINIYDEYQKRLKTNNALDFDDLIMLAVRLFKEKPDILKKYQERFKYILVDEYQDTNTAQYLLIKLLAQKHKNLCVVGDDDQCLLEGSKINTPEGNLPIETLMETQKVICPSGRGQIMEGTIEKIIKKEYKGTVVKVKTKKGNEIKATPNHIIFGRINPLQSIFYVYLMYKKAVGYRIGYTQGVRCGNKGEIANGLKIRLNQEHGDKMWILKVCSSKDETVYYEQLYAFKYGIPTTVFHDKSRNLSLTQKNIDKIFQEIDTNELVAKLMNDLLIFPEYPHHMAQAVIRGGTARRIINISFFGGRKTGADSGWHSHRICLNTSGNELRKQAIERGFSTRSGNRNTWRIETERIEYDEAYKYVEKISALDDNLEIVKYVRLAREKSFSYMPIAHLKPTMSIAIINENEIIEDIVEEVTFEEYDGYIYDLSVPHFRQYICEGIVVHNSIYQWRGADIKNILSFEEDYEETQLIKLEQNYRSTQNILSAANEVVKNNSRRKTKSLWTEKEGGDKIFYYTAQDEVDEAFFIVRTIRQILDREHKQYKDFAVLCRTTGQFRAIEESLIRGNIPYRVFGGTKFYDRKEIKDILAYFKIIANPLDEVSLKRVINTPKRGIGDTSWDKLVNYGALNGKTIYDVMAEPEKAGIATKTANSIKGFKKLIDTFREFSNSDITFLTNKILEDTGYLRELQIEKTVEAETRVENLQEFLTVTKKYDTESQGGDLSTFLAEISLVTDIDNYDADEDAMAIMTMHGAKGLEFPVVFVTGVEENLFPHSRSINSTDPEEIEEERRLCYVALTRAKEKVFLTRAWKRTIYGRDAYNSPSRFITEIPERYLESSQARKREEKSSFGRPMNNSTNSIKPSGGTFNVGDKVEHSKWGEGLVVSVKGSGDDAEVSVAFPDQGIKKLIAKYAPIRKVGG